MRDYAKGSPCFWTGDFGKSIRGDHFLQALAWYLITAPLGNMIGLYCLPPGYIAADLGSPLKGALKGLRALSERGFAHYDEGQETVWVVEQARHELGQQLDASDNKVKGIRRLLVERRKSFLVHQFLEIYADGYHLRDLVGISPSEAPSLAPSEGSSRVRDARARGVLVPALVLSPSPVLPDLPVDLATPEMRAAWEERLRERAEMGSKGKLTPTQVEAQFRKLQKLAAAKGIAAAIACVERAVEGHHQGVVFPSDLENGNGAPRPATPSLPFTAPRLSPSGLSACHPSDPDSWWTKEQYLERFPDDPLPWPERRA